MACCDTYKLGCFDCCGFLSFFDAPTTGQATGVFKFGNLTSTQVIDITEGEPMLFDLSKLNENGDWTMQVYINCTLFGMVYESNTITKFTFKTSNNGLNCGIQYIDTALFTPINTTDVRELTITGDDTAIYTNVALIGRTVLFVSTDSAVRIPTDYTFVSGTGTVTFISPIDLGTIIQILYK